MAATPERRSKPACSTSTPAPSTPSGPPTGATPRTPTGTCPTPLRPIPEQGGGGPMWSGFIGHPALAGLPAVRRQAHSGDLLPPMQKWLAFEDRRPSITSWSLTSATGSRRRSGIIWVTGCTPTRAGHRRSARARSRTIHQQLPSTSINLQLAAKIAGILGRKDDACEIRKQGCHSRAGTPRTLLRPRRTASTRPASKPYLAFPLLLESRSCRSARLPWHEEPRGGHPGEERGPPRLPACTAPTSCSRSSWQADRNDLIYQMASKKTIRVGDKCWSRAPPPVGRAGRAGRTFTTR